MRFRILRIHRPDDRKDPTCVCGNLAILVAAVFMVIPARAAVTESWVHRYSHAVSNAHQVPVQVARDPAGNVIVTGSTDDRTTGLDMLTIKYSGANGSLLWASRYNGPANTNDYPAAMAVDGNGNVVVAGVSCNRDKYSSADYYTAKYAGADGSLLWEKRYNGPWIGAFDKATAVAVDTDGNVVVTGSSGPGPPSNDGDYYTAKYAAADGSLLWEKRYSGPSIGGSDRAVAVAVDGSGDVVVTGYSGYSSTDFHTIKYAGAGGALLWEKSYNGPANNYDSVNALGLDSSGNVVVTGFSSNGTNYDCYTAKYATRDGALLWENRYNGPEHGYDYAFALAVDASGNVVITGISGGNRYTAKYAAADGALVWDKHSVGGEALATDSDGNVVMAGGFSNGTNADLYAAKYAATDGTLLWDQRYNGPANGYDFAYDVIVDRTGNVMVTGPSNNGTNSDYYTAKYAAADGALLWEQRCSGPANYNDLANGIAVDHLGNLAVIAASSNGTNYDYYTAKYAPPNGALLWEKRYNGPANRADVPTEVEVDGDGNVVVTGYSLNIHAVADFYTAKYATADGTLLWERRYNGPENWDGDDYPYGLVVDQAGNVVVTGSTVVGHDQFFLHLTDCYTAKYAAADGALLWEKRYDGPVHGNDVGTAVAVDGSGNVVVTGYSYNGGYNNDYYTAKYAAANGVLLWEKRYRSPNGYGAAVAVAVDGSGNVVVTGNSSGLSSSRDYYTAKYAAAGGELLWEKRYNGPANDDDFANAVTLDSGGNVVVTGSSRNDRSPAGNADYYTAKYAAANGALLWEQRYNGPGNRDDIPTAVAVDRSGNVVVTGYSYNGTNFDYLTLKYAVADGILLWEKRYNGPADGEEVVGWGALAIGPNGTVAITGHSDANFNSGPFDSIHDLVTIVYSEFLAPVSIEKVPVGVRLRFTGTPGRNYQVQRAPVVTGPWRSLASPEAPASGTIEYIDTTPSTGSAFYRIGTL